MESDSLHRNTEVELPASSHTANTQSLQRNTESELCSSSHSDSGTIGDPVLAKDCEVLLRRDFIQHSKVRANTKLEFQSLLYILNSPLQLSMGRSIHYLKSHKWLGYSVRLDACLCLPCSLFRDDESALSFV